MRVVIEAHIIRDGEKKPVRSLKAEYTHLTPERAIHLASTKTGPSRAEYQRERKKA